MERALTTSPVVTAGPAWSPRRTRSHGLVSRVLLWLQIWEERRTLQDLDDHMLADIGLTRHAVTAEVNRQPWDVPAFRDAESRTRWTGWA